MRRYSVGALILLALGIGLNLPFQDRNAGDSIFQPAQADSLADTLERRAALIRPTIAESSWQQIPWVTSAVEGQRQAQAENRPIFLWMLDEDPLERC